MPHELRHRCLRPSFSLNGCEICISANFFALLLHACAVAAILPGGQVGDEQTSIGYDPDTAEVSVFAPQGTNLTSILIVSQSCIFTGDPAQDLMFPLAGFDIDEDDRIFKQTIGSSFGTLSFGNIAQAGLSQNFILDDFDVTGSLEGGGSLGAVDLVNVPEPSAVALALFGMIIGTVCKSLYSNFGQLRCG